MRAEVRALGPKAAQPGVLCAVSGARPGLAADGAHRLADRGCRLLVSCGVSGGLDPNLPPGAVLRPSAVSDGAERFPLAFGDGGVIVAGSDVAVRTPRAKAALRAQTGAAAVDMESRAVARVAAERGLPAAALRVVGDPADGLLPPFALDALDPAGRRRPWPAIAGLMRNPRWLRPLMRLKRDTDLALRALSAEVAGGAIDRLLSAARNL